MRPLLCLALALPLCAQDSRTTRNEGYDVNGRPREGVTTATTSGKDFSRRVDLVRSSTGSLVPKESVEERVLSQQGANRVVERVIQRYDADGRLTATERVRVEETKNADGSGSVQETLYRTDVNGRAQVAERSRTDTAVNGGVTQANTVVERPTLNGSFGVTEQRQSVRTKTGTNEQETTTVSRPDANDRLGEAARVVTTREERNGQQVENRATYETGTTRGLALTNQVVTTTAKNPDGSTRSEINILATTVPGQAGALDRTQPQLREQQVVERIPGPNNSLTERVLSRTPNPRSPNDAGTFRVISESVCQGDCKK